MPNLHAFKLFEVAGKIGSTADNLKDGIEGETYGYKEISICKGS